MRLLRIVLMFAFLAVLAYPAYDILAVARSYRSRPLSYLALCYSQKKGFLWQEG
jgi:hypothetical protein